MVFWKNTITNSFGFKIVFTPNNSIEVGQIKLLSGAVEEAVLVELVSHVLRPVHIYSAH